MGQSPEFIMTTRPGEVNGWNGIPVTDRVLKMRPKVYNGLIN